MAFFSMADSIVGENLVQRFCAKIQAPEFRLFYDFQAMMENVHWEVYSLLIDNLIQDANEKKELFHGLTSIPSVARKTAWAMKWLDSRMPFATCIVAFTAIEGIFFSGSFAAIFWLKKHGLMPGFTFLNELISRDEGLHMDFGCYIYSCLRNHLTPATVLTIITDAVDIEKQFWDDALETPLLGLNASSINKHVEFMSNRLLVALRYEKKYKAKNPFDFMEMISLQGKSNFFEKRVSDYAKAFVGVSGNKEFKTDVDF
ncbi:related to Ribonucleoside-diphosphate reductase small chain [Armillaria ostoyae]|uniref:Related to Ribonucleoside-diphosphate reductase small chain n=1 Tax=Armillaria ostoyae TaxID=47428 RepID=A0A284R4N1_ARMOS|nr:related to Ribonucleoside-diphosphate reductase small chain [Armillaria ostoyae]